MNIHHRRRVLFVCTTLAIVTAGLLLRAQAPQPVGTWAAAGVVNGVPLGPSSVSLVDGRTLIVGGVDAAGAPTANVLVYDPVTNAVSPAGRLLAGRVGHTATLLADGRVLVAGGMTNGVLSADLELFDLVLGTSSFAGSMAQPRSGHAAARLPGGDVLIVGGSTITEVATANGEMFDHSTGGTTILPASLTQPRTGASATTLVDGRVLVAGGRNATGDLATAEIYDAYSQTFTPTDTQLSVPRSGHSAILLPHNNSVLIAGGTASGQAVIAADLFLPAEFPDPYSFGMGRFTAAAPMTAPRSTAVGGPGRSDGYAVVAAGGWQSAEQYRFATITTDKDDYPPGQRAVITGSGWQPGEEVRLLFQEDPAVHEDYVLRVAADASGNLYWDQWAPEEHDLNVRFYLLASGSRSRAQTTFTDGNIGDEGITIGAQNPTPVAPGGAATFSVTVNITGNSGVCTGTLTAAPSGSTPLPAGTTLTFSPNNTVSGGGGTSHTRTLTIQTPSSIGPNTTYGFTVTVSQGNDCQNQNSRTRAGTVVVGAAPNTAPIAAGQLVTTNEDTAQTITLSGSDADGNALTFETLTSPANGTLGPIGTVTCSSTTPSNCSAPVLYTPNLNFNGSDSFTFRVRDAATASAAATVSVTVNAVNDPPSFTPGGNVTVNEDSGAYSSVWATSISAGPANETGQTVTFSVSNNNPSLFGVQPAVAANGTLTFTPAANASGSATVMVTAQDNGGTANGGSDTSATQTFTITVNPVNDAPSFTAGGDVTVNEDASAYSQAWATAISAGPNESAQTVLFVVSNNNNALFTAQPAINSAGILTFSLAANAFGTATVTVYAQDNGGTANGGVDVSAAVTFTITVNSVNDPPIFTGGGNVTANEDSGAHSQAWATAVSAGPPNESGQTVTFNVSNNNNALFSAQPAVAGNGTLTFTPAANAFGVATVTVAAHDDGGTANGGIDTSAPQTFTITINPVNDPPAITNLVATPYVIDENGTVVVSGAFTDPDVGDAHTIRITWGDGTTDTLLSAVPGVFAFQASHQYPDDNPTGTSSDNNTIVVVVSDDGATTPNPADFLSATASRMIQVNNLPPAISSVSGPVDPIQLGGSASVSATFTDVGTADTHTCTINWDDGGSSSGTVSEASHSCTAARVYAAAGVYSVKITIADDDLGSASQYFQYVVVYDPSAGFVTGGGWFNSPAGAYAADPSLEGRANFGFVSKYAKGAKVPTGETEFQFKAGNMNFHSLSYDWLVVAGPKAQYKGLGTINGALAPNGTAFKFLLTATDGQVNGGGGQDKMRLKVWYENGGVAYLVYDNAPGSDDIDSSAVQSLGGGSIVVHSK